MSFSKRILCLLLVWLTALPAHATRSNRSVHIDPKLARDKPSLGSSADGTPNFFLSLFRTDSLKITFTNPGDLFTSASIKEPPKNLSSSELRVLKSALDTLDSDRSRSGGLGNKAYSEAVDSLLSNLNSAAVTDGEVRINLDTTRSNFSNLRREAPAASTRSAIGELESLLLPDNSRIRSRPVVYQLAQGPINPPVQNANSDPVFVPEKEAPIPSRYTPPSQKNRNAFIGVTIKNAAVNKSLPELVSRSFLTTDVTRAFPNLSRADQTQMVDFLETARKANNGPGRILLEGLIAGGKKELLAKELNNLLEAVVSDDEEGAKPKGFKSLLKKIKVESVIGVAVTAWEEGHGLIARADYLNGLREGKFSLSNPNPHSWTSAAQQMKLQKHLDGILKDPVKLEIMRKYLTDLNNADPFNIDLTFQNNANHADISLMRGELTSLTRAVQNSQDKLSSIYNQHVVQASKRTAGESFEKELEEEEMKTFTEGIPFRLAQTLPDKNVQAVGKIGGAVVQFVGAHRSLKLAAEMMKNPNTVEAGTKLRNLKLKLSFDIILDLLGFLFSLLSSGPSEIELLREDIRELKDIVLEFYAESAKAHADIRHELNQVHSLLKKQFEEFDARYVTDTHDSRERTRVLQNQLDAIFTQQFKDRYAGDLVAIEQRDAAVRATRRALECENYLNAVKKGLKPTLDTYERYCGTTNKTVTDLDNQLDYTNTDSRSVIQVGPHLDLANGAAGPMVGPLDGPLSFAPMNKTLREFLGVRRPEHTIAHSLGALQLLEVPVSPVNKEGDNTKIFASNPVHLAEQSQTFLNAMERLDSLNLHDPVLDEYDSDYSKRLQVLKQIRLTSNTLSSAAPSDALGRPSGEHLLATVRNHSGQLHSLNHDLAEKWQKVLRIEPAVGVYGSTDWANPKPSQNAFTLASQDLAKAGAQIPPCNPEMVSHEGKLVPIGPLPLNAEKLMTPQKESAIKDAKIHRYVSLIPKTALIAREALKGTFRMCFEPVTDYLTSRTVWENHYATHEHLVTDYRKGKVAVNIKIFLDVPKLDPMLISERQIVDGEEFAWGEYSYWAALKPPSRFSDWKHYNATVNGARELYKGMPFAPKHFDSDKPILESIENRFSDPAHLEILRRTEKDVRNDVHVGVGATFLGWRRFPNYQEEANYVSHLQRKWSPHTDNPTNTKYSGLEETLFGASEHGRDTTDKLSPEYKSEMDRYLSSRVMTRIGDVLMEASRELVKKDAESSAGSLGSILLSSEGSRSLIAQQLWLATGDRLHREKELDRLLGGIVGESQLASLLANHSESFLDPASREKILSQLDLPTRELLDYLLKVPNPGEIRTPGVHSELVDAERAYVLHLQSKGVDTTEKAGGTTDPATLENAAIKNDIIYHLAASPIGPRINFSELKERTLVPTKEDLDAALVDQFVRGLNDNFFEFVDEAARAHGIPRGVTETIPAIPEPVRHWKTTHNKNSSLRTSPSRQTLSEIKLIFVDLNRTLEVKPSKEAPTKPTSASYEAHIRWLMQRLANQTGRPVTVRVGTSAIEQDKDGKPIWGDLWSVEQMQDLHKKVSAATLSAPAGQPIILEIGQDNRNEVSAKTAESTYREIRETTAEWLKSGKITAKDGDDYARLQLSTKTKGKPSTNELLATLNKSALRQFFESGIPTEFEVTVHKSLLGDTVALAHSISEIVNAADQAPESLFVPSMKDERIWKTEELTKNHSATHEREATGPYRYELRIDPRIHPALKELSNRQSLVDFKYGPTRMKRVSALGVYGNDYMLSYGIDSPWRKEPASLPAQPPTVASASTVTFSKVLDINRSITLRLFSAPSSEFGHVR